MKESRDIEVHIEQIVLEGLSLDPASVDVAVRRELARLVAEHGLPGSWQRSGRWPSVEGGRIDSVLNADAARTGAQLARAIYAGGSRRP